jgi:hypothetical protein
VRGEKESQGHQEQRQRVREYRSTQRSRTFDQSGPCRGDCSSNQIEGLTHVEAASLLGLAQSDVSKLLRGYFAGYSYGRLFGYLIALGWKVRIEASEARTKKDARLEPAASDCLRLRHLFPLVSPTF